MAGTVILVVDDSPTQLKLTTSFLQGNNYEIITAVDGEDALEKAAFYKPDLIVLDVVMPKMDGYQACRKMKASTDTMNIPVIMLTSKDKKADEFWGRKQGADMYLTKPFEETELLAAVQKSLG